VRATRDYRWNARAGGRVTVDMTFEEFRETVEWLELTSPHDSATAEWRAELDRLEPPGVADGS
jgi:hypothetical protein